MHHVSRPALNHRSRRAFTLVEIMVVVVIIGILAAVAMPTFRQVTLRSKATAVVNDIRQFTAAFQTYSHEHGRWPDESAAGVIPPGMEDSLTVTFTLPTPIGGHYDWDNDVSPGGVNAKAAITITTANGHPLTTDAALVEMVGKLMGDDNIYDTTGSVRYNAGSLVFIIEQ